MSPKTSVVLEEPGQHVRRERGRVDLLAVELAMHGRVTLQVRLQRRRQADRHFHPVLPGQGAQP